MPSLTFIATANAVSYCGAKPVMVDVHPGYWCIDPERIEEAITPRTKALIPVHLYGHPCDMDAIMARARRHRSLDTESEQAIQKNLDAILKDRTAIIIAHRMSTVRHADNILVLDNGELVEQGTHEALMEQRGLDHYLAHQQYTL